MDELMLVGVGRMGRPYLAAARRLGLRVRAVESVARASALAGEVDDVRMCEGDLDEHWVAAAAAAAAAAGRPDGVVAFSEPQVMAAALLQESERLPGPGIHAAVLSRNKALQRGTFAAAGVRQPDHLLTDDLRAAADWAAARMPVVVKPLSSSGSSGVELVTDVDGYLEVARRRAGEGRLLVEAAVAGPEYSWEALVRDGQVWLSNTTAKETTGPPHFVEVSHRTGIRLAPAVATEVEGLAAAVLRALRMSTGIVHLEFRLAAAGPTLMEVAVRTPGDFIMDLLGLTYGVDWFELVVRAAMGLPLPSPSGPVRYAASYLPVAAPGVVTRIRGLDEVLGHPAVVHAGLIVAEGDVIRSLRSSAQRAGHVVLAADTREELEVALAEVRSTLDIRTRSERVTARTR
ncbi:ATP-grasp domain-containing protein [Geodermatophilus sp. CPCC 205506]|uniref:ATP-grasp domain-containing protein n=1 Tax=Geodermatophilus sp. CPCC 205506 TaxID=2936596 RepID=UPI003EEC014A